ncbi:MAG TPA: ABC transporter permease subunit [Tepidisphaeraceae bacterium]|nr:ABC transporter permease subunit [Tepidisphaeraceae bacterium]
MSFLAAALPHLISDYLAWWIAGVVVVGFLLAFGMNELARLSISRVWAISSVCFAESLRRKVLWVTPLGILGVIAIALLQHPVDQQEAVRQTIKFCLFASGTLVTITAIILASTNLPREIESRVIFTIVTKPTTRLEIVLGKVVGFARVSGLIVLIMGLFTFVFLEIQNVKLTRELTERLKVEQDPSTQHILQGYKEAGLLSTLSLEHPADFEVYSHLPPEKGPHWITGALFYSFQVPFDLSTQDQKLLDAAAEDPPRAVVLAINTMRLKRNVPTKDELATIEGRKLPMEGGAFGPTVANLKPKPQLSLMFLDTARETLIPATDINEGKLTTAPPDRLRNPDGTYTIATPLTPQNVRKLLDNPQFFLRVTPETPSVEYEVTDTPTVLTVLDANMKAMGTIWPNGKPHFVSGTGRYGGMQVVGDPTGNGSAADFRFDNVRIPRGTGGTVPFRFRGAITRGGDYDPSKPWSLVALRVRNRETGQLSDSIEFHPETNRDTVVAVPASYVSGGNFDVYVQGMDNGQWVAMNTQSVQLISAEHSFVVNLVKSLFILWLFSILVVVVAVFTSTWLSWPIAITLTLFILLGHWGVEQLGDALTNPGRGVAQDLGFGREAAQSSVVSASVDRLANMLKAVSAVLPDLSKFPVMDDITRGVSIPPRHVFDALAVLLYYGLPMLVLSFVILKNKEVAP